MKYLYQIFFLLSLSAVILPSTIYEKIKEQQRLTNQEANSLTLVPNIPLCNFSEETMTLSGGGKSQNLKPELAIIVANILFDAKQRLCATFFSGQEFDCSDQRLKFASDYSAPEEIRTAPAQWPSNVNYKIGIMLPDWWKKYKNLRLLPNEIGWGVYATEVIKAGSILCCYSGDFKSKKDIKNYDYAMETCNSFNDKITMDATNSGNLSRFINHDDDPNCGIAGNNPDSNPFVYIVANRDICTDEEVTINYGLPYWKSKGIKPSARNINFKN